MISPLLKEHIKPFEKYFKRPDVIEICVNRPGEVYLETTKGWEVKTEAGFTLRSLNAFGEVLATVKGQRFDDIVPLLSTAIPDYNFRIQFASGALVDSGIAIAIRVGTARRFPLDTYHFEERSEKVATKTTFEGKEGWIDQLKFAIAGKKNILVAGSTSSGKTTFLNELITHIPKNARLVVVEDSKELIIDQPNHVRFLKSKTGTDLAKITYKDIINCCMRMRPDRIIMGELDIENTVPFLRLLNTGHGGSMATIHADSPQEAIEAIILNAQLAGLMGPVESYARKGIDVLVHLAMKREKDQSRVNVQVEYLNG